MKITIYGAGYVGLVTAVCLAELGHEICCVEIDAAKIAILQQGNTPIYEENLEHLLQKNLKAEKIFFTQDYSSAVKYSEIQMIAVGTPSLPDGSNDLTAVFNVVDMLAQYIDAYKLIVMKSTVIVGTAHEVKKKILNQLTATKKSSEWIDVASNPEFLREGNAVFDFMQPSRIVIGVDNHKSENLLRQLYAPLIKKEYPFLVLNTRSAEMTKYASNAFLAMKISFINEMSQLAEHLGADIQEVKEGISYDPRINKHFLEAGCGFGGSCLPKDVSALSLAAEKVGHTPHLLKATLMTNEIQQATLFKKINHHFKNDLKNRVIAVLGLAFKPNTDDIRDASSLVLIQQLFAAGAMIRAYDPLALEGVRKLLGDHPQLQLCTDAQTTMHNADALVVVTEWDEFRELDLQQIKKSLRQAVIFDGRNIYDPKNAAALNIDYYGVGRGLTIY